MESPHLLIYIVDDDRMWSLLLKKLLEKSGYKVVGIAGSYKEAIVDLQMLTIDLVLLDVNLGGEESGIDIANYINIHLGLPFVYQSSESNKGTIEKIGSTCPLDFLIKPYSADQLLESLKVAALLIGSNRNNAIKRRLYRTAG